MLRLLNSPSNFLVSRLGMTNFWSVPNSTFKTSEPTLNYLLINRFLSLLFKDGFIFLAHPFRTKLFFGFRGFLPLPCFYSVEDMYKFYRLHRVKAKIASTYKTTYILRNFFNKLTTSKVLLYRLVDCFLVSLTLHLPHFYKLAAKPVTSLDSLGRPGMFLRNFTSKHTVTNFFFNFLQTSFFLRKFIL